MTPVQAAGIADHDLATVAGAGARPLVMQPRVAEVGVEGTGVDAGLPHGTLEGQAEVVEPVGEIRGGRDDPIGLRGEQRHRVLDGEGGGAEGSERA